MPILASSSYRNIYGKPDAYATIESVAGGQDAFITKYNTVGKAVWSARIATYSATGSEVVNGVITDTSGNIYVTGTTGSGTTTSFYNADGTMFQTLLASAGNTDAFIAKYNRDGRAQWVARVASSGADNSYNIAISASGNVYICGAAPSAIAYNSDGTTTVSFTASNTDAFAVKYNSNGFAQWAVKMTNSGTSDAAFGITVDSAENMYYTGLKGNAVSTFVNSDGTSFATTLPTLGNSDPYLVKYNSSGFVQWVANIGGPDSDNGRALVCDSLGNVYITGRGGTTGITTAYNSDGTAFGTTLANAGGGDAFFVKYDTNGFVQWVARVASSNSDIGYSITIDSSGDLYLTGIYSNTLTLYNSDGTAFGTTLSNPAGSDGFVAKYNSSGFAQWAARFGTAGTDSGFGVSTDSSGNVYLGGYFSGGTITAYNANGTAFGTTLVPIGNNEGFLVKYNSSGTVQWLSRLGTSGADQVNSVSVDSNGDVIATGFFTGGSLGIYGQSTSLFATLPNSGGTDVYNVKYNANGAPQWASRIASTGTDAGYGSATDSSGNLYVCGQGGSGVDLSIYNADGSAFATTLINIGLEDAYLVKYNTNGVVQWVTKLASTGTDIAYTVATDSSGNVYVAGSYGANPMIAYNSDASAFATTLPYVSTNDAFLVKYNSSGFVQWVTRIATTTAYNDIIYSVVTDSTGNVYVSGRIGGSGSTTILYNSDGTSFATTLSGGPGGFHTKYNSSGFVQWVASVDGPGTEITYSVAVDPSQNVYISGVTGAISPLTVRNSDGTTFGTIASANAAFVVKYNSTGFVQWTTRVLASTGFTIATDSSGNVYVAGQTAASGGPSTVYNSDGTTTLVTADVSSGFLVKYNTSGFAQWLVRIPRGAGGVIINNIFVDSTNSVYVTAVVAASTSSFTIYTADGNLYQVVQASGLLLKLDSNGNGKWVQMIRGTTTTTFPAIRGVSVDGNYNVYVTGSSSTGEVTQIYNIDTSLYKVLNSFGGQDSFVVKYSSTTTPLWAAQISSSGTDVVYGVATDTSGNVYVTGETGSAVFYNANGTIFRTIANRGSTDAFVVKYNTNGFVQWVARMGSTSADSMRGISTDSSGNVYIVGKSGTSNFIMYNSDETSFGTLPGANPVVVKYNTNGFVQWGAYVSGGDFGYGISTDSSGNVYIIGIGASGATMTPYNSDGTAFGTTIANSGSTDAFLVKYNTNGFVQWGARIGSIGTDAGYGISADSSGNVYVTGEMGAGGSATVFNSNRSTFATLTNAGGSDAFIVKYDINGFGQWALRVASVNNDIGQAIVVDSSGNVYAVGRYSGSASIFNSSGPSFGTLVNTGNFDAYLVKYDTNGFVQWATRIASTGIEIPYSVVLDAAGDVYIVGSTGSLTILYAYNADGTTFGNIVASAKANGTDSFLIKYNSSGVVQWMSTIAGAGTDELRGIALDGSNNIYVAGNFNASALIPTNA